MTVLKYAFVTLSLGTALALPTAALAYGHNNHKNDHNQHQSKDHKNHDKHDKDGKDCDTDDGGQGGDDESTDPTPTPTPTPTPVVSDTASDDNGVVLADATTPAVVQPVTLPVTGAGNGLVFVIAGGSALATYLLMKRRSLV